MAGTGFWVGCVRAVPLGCPLPLMSLPRLPSPSARPGTSFRCVVLAYVLACLGGSDSLPLPRRDVQAVFNRSGGTGVSTHLKGLCVDGWLALDRRTVDREAHVYRRGRLLDADPVLRDAWEAISEGLWGSEGLLTRFQGSSAFGHGCVGENRLLCLSAITRSATPVTSVELAGYLGVFMTGRTVRRCVADLMRDGLIGPDGDGLVAAVGWEETLESLVAHLPAGDARKVKVAKRISEDRTVYAEAVRLGWITPEERRSLRKLPCVRCGGRSNEIEHFPPRKFNKSNHPVLMWAICTRCNRHYSGFIRSLRRPDPPESIELVVAPGVDPGDLLRSSTEVGLRRFYAAADNGDLDAALEAIQRSWALWLRLNESQPLPKERLPGTRRPRSSRTLRNRGAALPESRLPN